MLTPLRWHLIRWRLTRPRAEAALPEALRGRLLAIPATARRFPIVPRSSAEGGLSWFLVSPMTPLAAGFVLALALSLAWGNPYLAGAATLYRVRDQASPATSGIQAGATTLAAGVADLGRTVAAAVPRGGMRAARALTAILSEPLDDHPLQRGREGDPGGGG